MKKEITAFVLALKDHLLDRKPEYVHQQPWVDNTSSYLCDDFDTEALMKEIDTFAAQFTKEE